MDVSNIEQLLKLGTNYGADNDMDVDTNDDDLDDELNAILSGKTYVPKSQQQTKRVQPVGAQQSTAKKSAVSDHKGADHRNDKSDMLSNDLLNIDKLSILEDMDDNNDNDDDLDENDETFLSEIQSIASEDKSYVNKSIEINDYKTSQTIDPQFQRTPQMQKPIVPQRVNKTAETYATNSAESDGLDQSFSALKTQTIVSNVQTKTTEAHNNSDILRMNALKDEYKRAALLAKKSGQQTTALSHIKTAKQIEVLVKAVEEGKPVDLSHLPPSPSLTSVPSMLSSVTTPQTSQQKSADQINTNEEPVFEIDVQNVELTTEDAKKFFNAPPPPNTVMEAMEQRLAKFKSTLNQANEEGNQSKARRLGRIVKQYDTAMKDIKKGKAVDFEELPTPPGFGPIPVPNASKPNVQTQEAVVPKSAPMAPKVTPVLNKTPEKPQIPKTGANPNSTPTPPKSTQKPNLKRASSTANKQLNYLLERQRLFKEAALESKQKGDIQQAKEYLRMAKGFEPLIEATQNGLPIDATSIPTPPQMNDDFVIVTHPDTLETNDLEKEEMFRKIEVELQNQIEMCKRNKDYFLLLGDISTSSKFEKYAVDSRKDLDVLTARWKNGQKVPNFKYETRTFSIVICNTEITTNEISVDVIKAVDIPGKPDIDTYVKIDFPFPNDRNQTARTKTIKNSVNPVFNETFKFEIDRKSRALPRTLKRHPLKLELMSKGGFLRNDTLIGTALIKLTDFENKCTIHESIELTEGRKAVGGRIEVKVKIREPLLSKQVEEIKDKWLVFL